jgi:glycerophosphoryl diester phosphodiesterase
MDGPSDWARVRPFAEPDWIAGPGIKLLRKHPDLVRRIRAGGTEVHVWTVNTEEDVDLCRELGVSAVITDKPGQTLEYLTR